jgi:hypothetical protein
MCSNTAAARRITLPIPSRRVPPEAGRSCSSPSPSTGSPGAGREAT